MMTQIEITYQQGIKLAELLHELRSDWDVKGCVNFIREARETHPGMSNFDLVVAAVRAAQNSEARTPAVIPLDGAHWRNAVPDRPGAGKPVPSRNPRPCERCRYPHPESAPCDVKRDQIDRDNPDRLAAIEAARQAATVAAHGAQLTDLKETNA